MEKRHKLARRIPIIGGLFNDDFRDSPLWMVLLPAAIISMVVWVSRRYNGEMSGQRFQRQSGMIPATSGMSAVMEPPVADVAEMERTDFTDVSDEMSGNEMASFRSSEMETDIVTSEPSSPPMASEDSPVEKAPPSSMEALQTVDTGPIETFSSDVSDLDKPESTAEPGVGENLEYRPPEMQHTNVTSGKTPSEVSEQQWDDLRIIEGIGPRISMLMHDAGIHTFQQLADAPLDRLDEILEKAGIRRIADPGTWSEQARLAAQGNLEGLDELKKTLRAGRRDNG